MRPAGTATFTVAARLAADSPRDRSNFASAATRPKAPPTRPSVTFTAANWNAPQTVTVTGVDDAVTTAISRITIMFTPTTSSDAAYAGLTPGNVDVVNDDNDSAGINVTAISGNTRENGTQAHLHRGAQLAADRRRHGPLRHEQRGGGHHRRRRR